MVAENHHYVPKFILRNFLSDIKREQVSVYDKHTDKTFVTSIKNIMSERRFNELQYGDFTASFEPVASKIEDFIIPRYRAIIENKRLDCSLEEKADLCFLISFQILRVKAIRNQLSDIEAQLTRKVEQAGYSMNRVHGWEPLTEDIVKLLHLGNIQEEIGQYAQIIAEKVLLLVQAPSNRTFYIGDNPVTLHNRLNFGPYGSLGLAVKGIEIYLPLSAELTICAFCPSIIEDALEKMTTARNAVRTRSQDLAVRGIITFKQMTQQLEEFEKQVDNIKCMLNAVNTGLPLELDKGTMDFHNSLQMQWANRYVIDMNADFKLARKHNKEFPNLRHGKRFSVS